MTTTDNLARATIAAFNATATEEQKRLRDAIAASYADALPDVPPAQPPEPTPTPTRAPYGSAKAAIIADVRAHPRSTSTEVAKRLGMTSPQVAELGRAGVLVREPSGRMGSKGPIYLYSVKESE